MLHVRSVHSTDEVQVREMWPLNVKYFKCKTVSHLLMKKISSFI